MGEQTSKISESEELRKIKLLDDAVSHFKQSENFLRLDEVQSEVCNQEIRNAIVDILAIGLNDTHPQTGDKITRHALSAKEIHSELNQRLDDVVKISNVYFHLQKLEEANLVEMVTQIPTGKKYTTYYGRTGKAFLPFLEHDKKQKHASFYNDKLIKLIMRLNPEKSEDEITALVKQSVQKVYSYEKTEDIGEWIRTMQPHIIDLDIDMRLIVDLLEMFNNYTKETVSAMEHISSLLQYDISA